MKILKENRIVSNAVWIVSCKIIKAFLKLFITMMTARYLGPSNYGLINYAASIVTFVTPLMQLGLDSILVHEIINDEENTGEIIGSSIFMNIISSVLCIIGIISFTAIVNKNEKDTIIVCGLYSILLVFQALEMIQYWFQAKLMSKYSALAMLFSYICVTVFQAVLLLNGSSIFWFALSNSIDFGIISVLLLFFYKKLGGKKLSFSIFTCKELIKKSRHYIVASMMVTVFAQTDRIMLKLMINNESVGYYSAANTCASMISFVFVAVIDSMRPTIFEGKKESIALFEKRLSLLYSIIIYSSLFASLFFSIFSSPIIHLMYGSQYEPSVEALRLICWFTTFSYLGTIRNIWIVAENKQKYLWIINFTGAILNIAINYVLIPKYGIMGASFASLITQIFTNLILGYIIKPLRNNNKIMINSLNPKNLIGLLKNLKA